MWVIGIAVAALAGLADAAPVESPKEPVDLTEAFLEQVASGQVDAAFEALPKSSVWASRAQQVEILRGQTKTALGLYGRYIGIERIRESRYSPSITRLTYLMKMEQHFLVWNLVFYKPRDRWELSAVAFVDQPSGLE